MQTNSDRLTIPKFPARCTALLTNLEIDNSQPGPLLGSVAAILVYLEQFQVAAAGQWGHFPGKHLADMNACLPAPLPVSLKRPRLRSYPNLEALWLLLRVSGLIQISGRKTSEIKVSPQNAEVWRAMSHGDRYAVLLEIWMIRGFPNLVEGRNPSSLTDHPLQLWSAAFGRIKGRGRQGATAQEIASEIQQFYGASTLGCLHLFGFLDIRFADPDPKGRWLVDKIKANPIGKAFLKVFSQIFKENESLFSASLFEELPFGILKPALEPIFPNWRLLLKEDEIPFQLGTMILKVSLKRAWRRLVVPTTLTFEDLASAVLDSVDFDDDHLYRFEIDTPAGRPFPIHHPFMEEAPWADEFQLGEMGLQAGDLFRFDYDFGEPWRFEILVEAIEDRTTTTIEVLQAGGPAPRQYAYPDDEDG